MQELMPLFPLQLVAFPGEKLNLHIFEPRYKQLIRECHENGSTFGIPAYLNDKVMDIGTEMRLKAVHKTYDNGEMDIKTEGIGLFRIDEYFSQAPGKLYAGGKIEKLTYTTDGDLAISKSILDMARELFVLLNVNKSLPASPEEVFTFEIAHLVGLNTEQKYQLLSIEKESERQRFMQQHLEQLIPIVKEMEQVRERINMNGHFKNIIPPNV